MTTFTVQFYTDNAPFEEDRNGEIARILRTIATQVEGDAPFDTFQTIFDVNGNAVGRFALKPAEYYQ